jgi:magnesium transporter
MSTLALTELLGRPVVEASGQVCGRVREVALTPAEDRARVSNFIVRTKQGDRLLPFSAVVSVNGGVRVASKVSEWAAPQADGLFLLERDLLDQQIIDVYGRKVVRVNDVDLHPESAAGRLQLKVGSVDVGLRGAIRRLLKGVVPMPALRMMLERIPPRLIPWDFVDLIETDPARRVKLKISHDRLAKLHPADIADIVEKLAPDEREAVFETLDEEVAAGALEEVRPKVQKAIVESLDSDRAGRADERNSPGNGARGSRRGCRAT